MNQVRATKTVVVVDDEQDIVELIAVNVKGAGFKVKTYESAGAFYRQLPKDRPDLIILDWMLPDASGLDICKELRADKNYQSIPLIMVTAKSEETDRVLGLELGADDYVTKPFSPRELVARVKRLLHRQERATIAGETVKIGDDVVMDVQKHEVLCKGKKIELTMTEFKILKMLADRPGFVFSREHILDHIWSEDKAVLDRTVDVHIKNLREKLGTAGKVIQNVRGIGYKLSL